MALGLRPMEARAAKVVSLAPSALDINWPLAAGSTEGQPRTWLPKANQEEIEQLVNDALGDPSAEVFSPEPLERVSRALAQSGWFDGTPAVTRGRHNGVKIQGNWRIPAAMVRYKGDDYLISADGKRLPSVKRAGLEKNFRAIIDPSVGPPAFPDSTPDYRTAWAGEDIVASLELLELVQAKAWYAQVAGIDVSEYSRTGKLTLVTPENTKVVWGGRVSKPLLGEVSTPQKLAHISQILHDHKRIDAGYPLIYVNSVNLQFDISASAKQP
jgi:hypothetical protein